MTETTDNQTLTSVAEEATTNAAKAANAHDDFDWSADKRNVRQYAEADRKKYESSYENSFVTISDNDIINGIVVSITSNDVVLNIGFKSDGLIPLSEFRDTPELKVGDSVEVLVVEKENIKGQLVLSRKQAKLMRSWQRIVDAFKSGEIVTGLITSKTKGGLICDLYGMETFLPGSQIDVKPITDYDQFVGKTMEFKVVKVNEIIKNAVVSHKALIESDLENQRAEIISRLEKGQVLEGTIKNITDFGAFIDLGGIDGLLYITDISWGRINHPTDVLKMNQKINVVVLDYDDEKKRISLGMKQLTPHPWEVLGDSIQVGSIIKGKIVNVEDYGAFVEIQAGVEGLIHVSEISWSNAPINSKEYFKNGSEIEAKVVNIDKNDRKMSLSLKALTPDPWSEIETNFPVGSRVKGVVKNTNPYGVFVELADGITGFIHVSDLSWVKRVHHPNEFTKVGNEIEAVVLDIDKENRKLSLGHKQIEEDPWDTFENVFPIGSVHQGTVAKKDEKGAVVILPYGLEAYAPYKHLKKENGKNLETDETADFKIKEFDRGSKRIVVSHTLLVDDKIDEVKKEETTKRKKESDETRENIQKLSKKTEKSTLGDLGALKELKKKLKDDGAEKPATEETKETPPAAEGETAAE